MFERVEVGRGRAAQQVRLRVPIVLTSFCPHAANTACAVSRITMRYTGSACVERISLSTMNERTCRDKVRLGEFEPGSKVLYAHLGGVPALSAYSEIFRNG